MGEKKPRDKTELRKKAEKNLKEKSKKGGKEFILSQQGTERLVHELQVHQIELELQNEELQRAQAELLDSQRRYADLFNFAPAGYLVLDLEGLIKEANTTAAGMLGVTKRTLIGKPLTLYVHTPDRIIFSEHIKGVFYSANPDRASCIVRLKAGKAALFHAYMQSSRFVQEQDEPYCLIAITDISRLKELEAEKEAYIRDLEAFGYTASHELRAPLIAIGGFSRG